MKVNEKSLAKLATSSSRQPDKEGYLFKRGSVNKSFQKRWCVLKGNLFYYFERKTDREPLGCIILEGCRTEVVDAETELFAFVIAFAGASSREYILGTDSQESMESWMKALSRSSYDYLRAVVADLQKQLDEITETEKRRLLQSASTGFDATRSNPFDDNIYENLVDFSAMQTNRNGQTIFTRKPFTEVHSAYGDQFRTYLEERRPKRPARGITAANQVSQSQEVAPDALLVNLS